MPTSMGDFSQYTTMEHFSVVIIGAGPVGLLVALRLGQAGIKTLVLEQHTDLLFSTRGCAYQPVVIDALDELGILDKVKEQAHLNRDGVSWRDAQGKELGFLKIPDDKYVLLLGQKRLNDLLLKELQTNESVTVRFDQRYVGYEQDAENKRAQIMVHRQGLVDDHDDYFVSGDWVVGADGARSGLRQSLSIPYEGFTFTSFQVIGVDVYHDFTQHGWSLMNYVRDPQHWCGMLYTGETQEGASGTPLWRVAYAEPVGLSLKHEDIRGRATERLRHYAPRVMDFDIKRAEPYQVQQRCAAQASKGRAILVGDALHSNNPAGGYGLTTGMLDGCIIGSVLAKACLGEGSEELVFRAAEDRRQTWLTVTNKISMGMFEKLSSFEPDAVRACEEYFRGLQAERANSEQAWATVQKIAGTSVANL